MLLLHGNVFIAWAEVSFSATMYVSTAILIASNVSGPIIVVLVKTEWFQLMALAQKTLHVRSSASTVHRISASSVW